MTNASFELLERKRYRMSWGPATVFIHRKLNADGSAVGPAHLNILPSDSITYDDDKPSSTGDRGPPSPFDDIDDDDDEDDGDEDEDDGDEDDGDVSDGNGDYDDDIDMYISQKSAHVLSNEEQVHVSAPSPLSQPSRSSVGSPMPIAPGSVISSPAAIGVPPPPPPSSSMSSSSMSSSAKKASPSSSAAFVGNRSSPSTSSSSSIAAAAETPPSAAKATGSTASSASKTPPSTAKQQQQSPTKIPKPETPRKLTRIVQHTTRSNLPNSLCVIHSSLLLLVGRSVGWLVG